MPMNKIQDVKLETTATYQPLSDLNVRFWSQDKNTAELRFIITRNQFPLSLSKENVKVIIALESGSNFISSDDFIIDSEVEGVARYIIPTDFMRVAGNVTGQVYVTTLDKEEVIVERQFKFTVSNDLLSDYPSEDKLRYIKTFDDLRTEIASRVSKLESDMETMEDYVTQVQDTTQEGVTLLTNLIQQKQDAYNANHTAKMKELNDKGLEYSAKFDDDKVYMDDKFQAFQESVNGSGLITTGQSKDWQKYKLTDDDGNYPNVSLNSDLSKLQALPPGFYYGLGTPITISGVSTSGFIEVSVKPPGTVKHIVYRPYNANKEFVMRYYNEWSGWENKMDELEKTIDAQSKANTAENNARQYTEEKVGELHKILFNGTVSNVGSKVNLLESLYNYNMIIISGETPGGVFYETVLPAAIKTNIMIQKSNLRDSDGEFLGVYEIKLEVTNGTTLTIANDVSYDMPSGSASGPNRNAYTINRIEGWK